MALLHDIKLALLPIIDFHETFSPMINPIIVLTVLSITLNRKGGIRQLDVNNVFLNGHLTEEIYMALL